VAANRLLRIARPMSFWPIRPRNGGSLVVGWRDFDHVRLGGGLALGTFDGLNSTTGLNGLGGALRRRGFGNAVRRRRSGGALRRRGLSSAPGLDGTVDTVDNRTRGVGARGP